MINFTELSEKASKFAVKNSPAILTGVGVAGVLTTAFLTGKASFRAAKAIQDEVDRFAQYEDKDPLDTKEKFLIVWKYYIPPAGAALLTVGAIVAANQIGTRRATAVAAAYALSEKAWAEYREKIVEKLGEKKETAIRAEVAQDKVNKHDPEEKVIFMTGNGEVLCLEAMTGRYFRCEMETLKKAQNDTNYQIIRQDYAALSDFYDKIGLPNTSDSDNVGWNVRMGRELELEFSSALTGKGEPVLVFSYKYAPQSIHY